MSSSDTSSPNTKAAEQAKQDSAPSSPTSQRRKSSGAFANLMQQKRNPNDAEGTARRASFHDQKPGKPGMFGTMWHNFTKGGGNN
ncbi:hypothetical protein EJ06DRAFT_526118 [Trichodelitschia bisporula]|uniref:Conidiation-specific protein 8 n=1 Tax=Trichodelitschia bisporula TaxID=703511 RepID=A0A6G1IBD2_9PEZI|nr:hypothetical protein EJ06DRAFT_526118 [Trichodelitschia bisporula]